MQAPQTDVLDRAALAWRSLVPSQIVSWFSATTWGLIGIVALLFLLVGICRVFAKAGYPAFAGLLLFLPGINVFVFLFFAFWPWPREREIRVLRRVHKALHDETGRRIERGAA